MTGYVAHDKVAEIQKLGTHKEGVGKLDILVLILNESQSL